MASSAVTALPDGYSLEQPSAPSSGLPDGYTVESPNPTPQQQADTAVQSVPRPSVDMQTSQAGELEGGPADATVPPKGQMAKQTQPNEAVGALAVGGAGALAASEAGGLLSDFAVKHLAGHVLPGAINAAGEELTSEAVRQTLQQVIPKVLEFSKAMGGLGVGLGGVTYLLNTLMGGDKKKK